MYCKLTISRTSTLERCVLFRDGVYLGEACRHVSALEMDVRHVDLARKESDGDILPINYEQRLFSLSSIS